MFNVAITVTGSKQVMANLAKLENELSDMKKAMGDIVDLLTSYFANEAFSSRGGVFNQRWRELNTRYAARKRKIWGSKPILIASGDMSKNWYGESDKNSAVIGNKSEQFKYHQSSQTRYVLPRRQMIGVNSRVKDIVRKAVADDIRRKMRKV